LGIEERIIGTRAGLFLASGTLRMNVPSISTDELLRLVIDEAKDFAIFLLDLDGRVISWNAGAARIFGYTEEQIVGKYFGVLFTAADREHGVDVRELATARETGRAPDTRWHVRSDGRLFFADGVTTALYEAGTLIGYSKISRDHTERYMAEKRLAAQLELTNLFATDQPIDEMARRVLEAICTNLGWDMGALWVVGADELLHPIDFWFAPVLSADAAAQLFSERALARGSGLPGRVWEMREPVWIVDLARDEDFPRLGHAQRAGLHAAMAFPVIRDGRVTGVMEFFSRERREPDQALLPVMSLLGSQIGDYVERRETADALRLSELRYRVITETAQDAIFTIGADGRIIFASSAVERVFGWKPEELVGKTLDVVIPDRYRAAHRNGVRRYVETQKKHIPWQGVELPGLHRDGHEIPLELAFGEWKSESRQVFTGFARDITERRRAAEELRESLAHEQQARAEAEASRLQLERRAQEEASFRHLASALTGAVEMADVLMEITNRATLVTRADGVYIERIINSAPAVVEVVSAAGRGAPPRGTRVSYPGSMTDEIMRSREPVILTDMASFGRSMAPYLMDTCGDCQVLVTPLVADEETLGALVLLNSRESGRTFGDGDVIRARTLGDMTSLALRRVRLMEEERQAKEVAEQAVRVRDETLGIVSHDLRNPLTTVALSADLLIGATEDEQRELVETIRGAAGQMQRLIQDLLDVARVEAGRLAVQKTEVDLAAVARQACDANAPIAEKRKQRLICDVPVSLPPVSADRDRIVQLLGNLIGNAMKFTPPGGCITVSVTELGNAIQFEVSDTGPGIPDSDLKNVFRPYWQAKKTAHMGAGLGLAIVRGIVEAHGGTVRAANAAGGGAVFTFVIPKTSGAIAVK
jgi:PAS domain S-box-containing protein